MLTEAQKIWVDEVWNKLDGKLEAVSGRSRGKFPSHTDQSTHNDMIGAIHCWTNGFWPGINWLMYVGTGKEGYRKTAETGEKLLDAAFESYEDLSHDVGFLWKLASWPNYRLNGNRESYRRLRKAADCLMARYNPAGEYIRAWNDEPGKEGEKAGWTIIDTLMNLPLLYWASDVTKDPRFRYAGMKHADKAISSHVRGDGSVRHIAVHDADSGERIGESGGQGYGAGSGWSRGQAWAIYGFVLSFLHTGKEAYLNTAKQAAHYFIANVCGDWLPKCDFRSPEEPLYYDCSAGLCAACGMLEIAKIVPEYEKKVYLHGAFRLLETIEKSCADWSDADDFIIGKSTVRYQRGQNLNIIYADYFFAEAIYKLKGFEPLFW